MNNAPSGRNFKFGKRKLAKSAERRGLVRDSSRTVLIESSIRGSFSLDNSIESSQVTSVLTFPSIGLSWSRRPEIVGFLKNTCYLGMLSNRVTLNVFVN